jgi:hypothetical protein
MTGRARREGSSTGCQRPSCHLIITQMSQRDSYARYLYELHQTL